MKPITKHIKSMTLLEKIYGERPEDFHENEELNKIIELKTMIIEKPTDFSKCIIKHEHHYPRNIKAAKMIEDIEKLEPGKILKIPIENKREANNLQVHLLRYKECLTNPNVSFIIKDNAAYVIPKESDKRVSGHNIKVIEGELVRTKTVYKPKWITEGFKSNAEYQKTQRKGFAKHSDYLKYLKEKEQ